MSGYVQYLASHIDALRATLAERRDQLRNELAERGQHRRIPEAVAHLQIGWEQWLLFAEIAGAIDAGEAALYRSRIWRALTSLGGEQSDRELTQSPGDRFLELIRSALATQQAHLTTLDNTVPRLPQRYGWRLLPGTAANEDGRIYRALVASGSRHIGWVADDERTVYLEPGAAYAVACAMAADQNDSLAVTQHTLWRRMRTAGLLAATDTGRDKNLLRLPRSASRTLTLQVNADLIVGSCCDDALLGEPSGTLRRSFRPVG